MTLRSLASRPRWMYRAIHRVLPEWALEMWLPVFVCKPRYVCACGFGFVGHQTYFAATLPPSSLGDFPVAESDGESLSFSINDLFLLLSMGDIRSFFSSGRKKGKQKALSTHFVFENLLSLSLQGVHLICPVVGRFLLGGMRGGRGSESLSPISRKEDSDGRPAVAVSNES